MPCNEEKWGAGTRHIQRLREIVSHVIRLVSAAAECVAFVVDYGLGADIKADIGYHFALPEFA